jgi:hypothetical protein
VVAAAPRIHPRLVERLVRLDDAARPIAELNRDLGAFAEAQGLTRPSYETVRELVHVTRSLRRAAGPSELREIWNASVRGGYMIAFDQLVRAVFGDAPR